MNAAAPSGNAKPGGHWSRRPETVNELAAQYVLGTLSPRAHRRLQVLREQSPLVAEAVAGWEQRLQRLGQTLPPVAPPAALWDKLALRAGLPPAAAATAAAATPAAAGAAAFGTGVPAASRAAGDASSAAASAVAAGSLAQAPAQAAQPLAKTPEATTAAPRSAPSQPDAWARLGRWLQQLLAPVPAGALAMGLVAGVMLPALVPELRVGGGEPALDDRQAATMPASYVGVLATPEGRPGLVVASLRHSRQVDLKQLSPLLPPPGQTLFLWRIDAQGRATPIGAIPAGPFTQATLPDTAEKVFAEAVELGVTLEAAGAAPAEPQAWVYRGLCGKVWPPPPAGAGATQGAPSAPR